MIITKKIFLRNVAKNKNNPNELWRNMKSLGMTSKGGRQSKIPLKGNGVVSFYSNNFRRFFSNLADSDLGRFEHSWFEQLPCSKNTFGIKTTEEYYKKIRNECEDFAEIFVEVVEVTKVNKILKKLDVTKASEIPVVNAARLFSWVKPGENWQMNFLNPNFASSIKLCKSSLFHEKNQHCWVHFMRKRLLFSGV